MCVEHRVPVFMQNIYMGSIWIITDPLGINQICKDEAKHTYCGAVCNHIFTQLYTNVFKTRCKRIGISTMLHANN